MSKYIYCVNRPYLGIYNDTVFPTLPADIIDIIKLTRLLKNIRFIHKESLSVCTKYKSVWYKYGLPQHRIGLCVFTSLVVVIYLYVKFELMPWFDAIAQS